MFLPAHGEEQAMGDSVSCTMDSAHKFTCEVQVDSDFDTPEPVVSPAPPAAPAPPQESSPAVSQLVSSFGSKTVPPPPSPPIFTVEAIKECASSALGVASAAATGVKLPYLAVLTMFKAGLDAAMCLAQSHNHAVIRSAQNYCVEQGNTVLGSDANSVTCQRESAK